jgi:hypothetical protein
MMICTTVVNMRVHSTQHVEIETSKVKEALLSGDFVLQTGKRLTKQNMKVGETVTKTDDNGQNDFGKLGEIRTLL